ncbi:DUF4136 domain-containing protein [Danxiaibacter flavus]|uniref:DUF4136 domain-containing protein n=1 Tax=Danxiaibacter flavus TaxID=3049108 RepID=A0ABV3ZEG3_9BACT|nr:DUF4136 domain-containing protein [Chitinophagaceae bacterium DXS]
MRKIMSLFSAVVLAALFITGCTKEPLNNLTNEESRIYITNRDSAVNFNSYTTFSISDSVGVIDNGDAYKSLNAVDQAYLNAVTKYMKQAGYTLVEKGQKPDLGINVSRIYQTSTGVMSYPDYWSYYGGYWDPYYWGYGGFGYGMPFYAYSVYSITEGALSIDLLDLKNVATNKDKIQLIWNGLIRGSGIFNEATADSQVKALFDQSAYLHK